MKNKKPIEALKIYKPKLPKTFICFIFWKGLFLKLFLCYNFWFDFLLWFINFFCLDWFYYFFLFSNNSFFLSLLCILFFKFFIFYSNNYFVRYKMGSAPFYLYVIERAIELLVPAVLCLAAGIIIKRKPEKRSSKQII